MLNRERLAIWTKIAQTEAEEELNFTNGCEICKQLLIRRRKAYPTGRNYWHSNCDCSFCVLMTGHVVADHPEIMAVMELKDDQTWNDKMRRFHARTFAHRRSGKAFDTSSYGPLPKGLLEHLAAEEGRAADVPRK